MRDYVELAKRIEGIYPSAAGGTTKDEPLRASLVPWLNDLFKELEREQRWSGSYSTDSIITSAGTAGYSLPSGLLTIERIWRTDYLTGQVTTLKKYDPQELRRVYGDGANSPLGAPTHYGFVPWNLALTPSVPLSPPGTMIQFFPTPDAETTGGVYDIIVEGHRALLPIGETSGTTTAASTTLTVPSTVYLSNIGVLSVGDFLSVRGAGEQGVGGVADTHITSWINFASATQVLMGTASPTAVGALAAQCFFNSRNWLLEDFPKVAEFGLLRMVASYLRDDSGYVMWEQRFQHEMELMRGYEFDKDRSQEVFAVGVSGQNQSELRRQDQIAGIEVRGG